MMEEDAIVEKVGEGEVTAKDETAVVEKKEEPTPWWKVHKHEDGKHRDWRCLGCGKVIELVFLTTPNQIRLCRSCGESKLVGRKMRLEEKKDEPLDENEYLQVRQALKELEKYTERTDDVVNRIKTG